MYRPSCARLGNAEGNSEAKPHTEVSIPSRMTGQSEVVQSWPMASMPEPATGLSEQIYGIVDRFANEGDAKAKRDPVDHIETECDGSEAGERATNHRQEAKHQQRHGAINDQQ